MKLPQIKNFKWSYLALSFFAPLIGLLIMMLLAGCAPFGTSSLMSSDAWHQYFPFFKSFRQALLSGESLLYNWDIGMGIDYLGLIAYYLGSPLNLLSLLVPENWLLGFFNLLLPVKLSFAGLFFAVFLKEMFGKDDLSLPLFASFYALCAWAMGYQWNIMWLDTFALLPLVALGTIQLLRDKKFLLYTGTLFLSIFSNYYVGFFVCIFVLLLFICYQICRCRSFVRFWQDFGRIALFTVLAIGMTAVLELPALAALQTTQSSVNKFPQSFSVNMVTGDAVTEARNAWNAFKTAKEALPILWEDADITIAERIHTLIGEEGVLTLWWKALISSLPPVLEGMKKVAGNISGGITPTYKEGLPNLYCGVGTAIFAFLFLTCRGIKLRDKLCSVVLLLFFMISFILRQLDYIWHGFHFTNMIPYRFSFLFSFVLLYMAYRAFLMREQFKLWQLLVAGVLYVGILLCYEDLTDPVFLTFNIIFLVLYIGALVYTWLQTRPLPKVGNAQRETIQKSRNYQKSIASIALAGILGLEFILNIVNAGTQFPYAGVGSYPRGTDDLQAVTKYMQENEDGLYYRAEVTHSQTLNDSALIGYTGISTFTSSANVKVTEFMKLLGYAAKNTYNRYNFEESSPVSNLFLNLKYMIERDGNLEENPYFDHVYQQGKVTLLENNAYLPLGFLAESTLGDMEFTNAANAFAFQNQLFTAATGIREDVWELTPAGALTITPNGTNVTNQTSSGYCSYKNEGSKTTLYYTYNITQEGFLCLDLTMSARNSFTVWKNGTQVTESGEPQMTQLYSESISLPQTLAVCDVKPGDTVQLRITCKANESGTMTIRAGILNEERFRAGYDILCASTLELTTFTNTAVEGTIHCDRDGLLYTSIPQNGTNWSVTVDGKEAKITPVGDVMIGIALTEGTHTVRFSYRNDAFRLGLTVSLCCAAVFGGIVFVVYFLPRLRRKGKYQS